MQDLLKVDEVVPITTRRWLVRGRAWQTLQVRDQIYVAVGRSYKSVTENNRAESILVDQGVISLDQPFTIVSISTYRHNVHTLDKGLTGEIVLEGEDGTVLKDNTLLVKP
jgi:hypothetical protein